MSNKSEVIVVGAGASGLVAAISAARSGAKVIILEHMEAAGKKLLSTGNGKCNFTNKVQGVGFYRGQNPAFVLSALEQFGLDETLNFFEELGLYYVQKRDGYYYPANGQAAALRKVLLMETERLKIPIHYNIGIRSMEKNGEAFIYNTKQNCFESRACIIATGSKAAKKTGSDGSGVPYIVGFGHRISEFSPALVQLQGKQSFLEEIAGIRADAVISLYVNGTQICQDTGEIQLTGYGVSGIPAFQVSRYAVIALKEGKLVFVTLDFVPGLTLKMLTEKLQRCFAHYSHKTVMDALTGLLHQRLIPVLLTEAGLPLTLPAKACQAAELQKLAVTMKQFRIDITGSKSFDDAQVCAGGVCTDEINNKTMESSLVKRLYFAGEVIDIDGMCGGYNLQWAWSSGWVAGHYGGKK